MSYKGNLNYQFKLDTAAYVANITQNESQTQSNSWEQKVHSGLEESVMLVCSQLIIKAEALHGSHTFSTVNK